MNNDHPAPVPPSEPTTRVATQSTDEPLARVLLGVIVVFLILLVLAAGSSL